jgi:hemoglobin
MPSFTRSRITTFVGALLLLPFLAVPAVAQSSAGDDASLYDRLGGLPAIALVVSDFMDDFMADPLVMANPAVRERKSPENGPYITFQVTTLVCQLTGGPCEYTGLGMGEAHAGLGVSAAEWDRMAEIFGRTLERHAVPEREQQELFALLGPARDDIVVADPD